MKRKCLWTIVLLALLTCAGLAGAQSVEADYAAIRQIWANYAAFVEKGGFGRLAFTVGCGGNSAQG